MSNPDNESSCRRGAEGQTVWTDRAIHRAADTAPGCILDRRLVVTTSHRANDELSAQARDWARRLGVPLVPRHYSLEKLVTRRRAYW